MSHRVIAIGSPFGADRAAWSVVDGLRGRVPAEVELITLDRPGAALITRLDADIDVILIDAAIGGPTDRPFVRVLPEHLARDGTRLDTHRQQIADTLALAKTLGRLPRRLAIYAIDIVADNVTSVSSFTPSGVRLLTVFLLNKLNECGTQPDQGQLPLGPLTVRFDP